MNDQVGCRVSQSQDNWCCQHNLQITSSPWFSRTNSILNTFYFFTSNNFLIISKQDLEHIAGFDKTCTSRSQARTQSPNQGTPCRFFREICIEIVAAVETIDLHYHLKEAFYSIFQPPPSSPTTLNADGSLTDFPHFAVGIHKTTTDLLNLQYFISWLITMTMWCLVIFISFFIFCSFLIFKLCW